MLGEEEAYGEHTSSALMCVRAHTWQDAQRHGDGGGVKNALRFRPGEGPSEGGRGREEKSRVDRERGGSVGGGGD